MASISRIIWRCVDAAYGWGSIVRTELAEARVVPREMSNRHAGARDRATLRSKGVRSWRRSPSIAVARTSIPTAPSGAKKA